MSDVWAPDPRTYTDWVITSGDDTPRITEASITRITEDGRIRIIERFASQWTAAPQPTGAWTPVAPPTNPWTPNPTFPSNPWSTVWPSSNLTRFTST